ncbi:hypothetical protein NC652_024288 [Populus alba x Populus x berolinensis]|nr:hypothetical protein NC652_024288 [Populus alba x Populus x berolinensis]
MASDLGRNWTCWKVTTESVDGEGLEPDGCLVKQLWAGMVVGVTLDFSEKKMLWLLSILNERMKEQGIGGGGLSDQVKCGCGNICPRRVILAITALKKGAYLLKYGRRGKPKFCPFRLSSDESVLIWFSGKKEKHLRLSHVSRIVSGQRTPIFQRYPRPEKEYQSFSLIYNERSLDLICKDKDEAEVWFSGLKALISRSNHQKGRTESRSDGIPSEANSPRTYTRRSSPLNSPFGSNDGSHKDVDHHRLHSPYESPPRMVWIKHFLMWYYMLFPKRFFPFRLASGSVHSLSSGGSDSVHGHMKAMAVDAFRVSLSSAVSSLSQGSGHDDGGALGDVFIWGEGKGMVC